MRGVLAAAMLQQTPLSIVPDKTCQKNTIMYPANSCYFGVQNWEAMAQADVGDGGLSSQEFELQQQLGRLSWVRLWTQ